VIGMEYDARMGPHPPPKYDAWAFHEMVAASIKYMKSKTSQFVKNLDEMPKVSLFPSSSRRKALNFH
jgi:hypothetical protein